MKRNLMFLGVLSLFLAFTSCTKEENIKADEPTITDNAYEVVTYGDIQAVFGDNIYVENAKGDIDPNMEVYWMGGDLKEADLSRSQCGPDIMPCAAINGWVNSQIVPIANECCCVFGAGTICCGQQGQLLAVLVLVTPRDPNCGIIAL